MLPAERDPGFVIITAATNPFRVSRDIVMVREGGSLADMLREAQPDPVLAHHARIFINGHTVERENWHRVYPKEGTHVEIRILPSGGGGGQKNVMRSVLMLAVMAMAIVIPPLLPAAMLGFTIGSTAMAVASAVISVAGSILVNTLIPVRPPKLQNDNEQPVFGIEAARNRSAPFSAVPQVLGRHRVAPNYGAAPYTEIVGQDQYLRMLFVWGVGPLHIDETSLKIGETPLDQFEGVEIEHRQGYEGDAPLTLYPDAVVEDPIQLLLADAEGQTLSPAQVRTSSVNADELGIDFSWPIGITEYTARGDNVASDVTLSIRYRAVGSSTWIAPSSFTAKTFPASWHDAAAGTVNFSGNSKSPVRHGLRWAVPRGQYDVQVVATYIKHPGTDRPSHQVFWTALRTFTDEDPINSRVPVAKTALRIKASDQLNGAVDEFNGVVTTLGKDWNGTSWVDNQQIRNPASLYRHIMQGKANAAPLPDDRLDLVGLSDWHEFCLAHEFTFDQVRTGGSVWDALADCSAAGRATPAEPDGRWGVVIDRPQVVPVSHITPRNSSGFLAEKAFIELPHGFRIPFVNAAENYRMDEQRVYRDGYDSSNATKFEALEFPGVTDSDQIWKMGRYRLAQAIHQPERWTFRQDMEYLTYQRGDRIKITHDVLLLGLRSGRVKAIDTDASNNVIGLVLDETVTMVTGEAYGIAIRTMAAGEVTTQVTTVNGDHNEVSLVSPIPAVGGLPAVERGNIFGFGLLGQETDDALVVSIRPEQDFRAMIMAVPYREEIYSSDTGDIPPFDSRLTPLVELNAPVIIQVVSHESALAWGPDGSLRTRMMISFRRPRAADQLPGFRVEARVRPAGTEEPWQTPQVDERTSHYIIISGILDGSSWDIKLWFEAEGRLPGPSSIVFGHTVTGKTGKPGPVTGITIWGEVRSVRILWDEHPQADFSHVRIETTPGLTYESPTIVGSSAGTGFTVPGVPPGTVINIWLTVVDTSGNESDPIGPFQSSYQAVSGNEIQDGAIGTSKLVDASVIASKIAQEAISVQHFIAPVKGRALNPDPHFMDPSVWPTSASFSFETIEDGKIGNRVLRASDTAIYTDGIVSQRVLYDPDKTYRFSVWVRRVNGSDGRLYGVIRALDANGVVLSTTTSTFPSKSGSNLYPLPNKVPGTNWTFYDFQFGNGTGYEPPTGTKFLTVGALLNYLATTGEMEIQDLRIEQVIGTDQLVDGSVIAEKIATNAVITSKISDNAVDNLKLAAGAVTSAKLVDGAILEAKLAAGAVTSTKIVDGAVISDKIAAAAIGSTHLADLAVTAAKLADSAITTGKIADGAIETGKLAAGAVGTTHIQNLAVTAAQVAASAIETSKLADSAITTGKLAANAVTAAKIAANTVTAAQIAAGTLTATEIASSAITTDKLAANAVTAAKIGAGQVTAGKIAAGAVTATEIAAGTITGEKIAAETIGTAKLIVSTRGKALNPDPFFLDGLSLYSTATGGLVVMSSGSAQAGSQQVRSPQGAGTGVLYSDAIPAQQVPYDPAKTYRASVWVRRWSDGSGTNGSFYGLLRPLDYNKSLITDFTGSAGWAGSNEASSNLYFAVNTVGPQSWVRYELVFGAGTGVTPPNGTKFLTVGALLNYEATVGYMDIQDLRIEEAIEGSLIVDGAIVASKIAAGAIETDKLSANAVTAAKIATATITATQIASRTITAGQIATNAITANEIAASAIGTDQLAANAITAAKIATATITATQIASRTITAGQIASNAITANEIAAGAITANEIAANAVTADKIAANSVDATKIAALTITGDKIAANTLSASKLVVTSRGKALNTDPKFQDEDFWASNLKPGLAIVDNVSSKLGSRILSAGAGYPGAAYFGDAGRTEHHVPYDTDKTYRVSFWTRGTSSPASNGRIYGLLRAYDENGALLTAEETGSGFISRASNNYYWLNNYTPSNSVWTYHEYVFGFGTGNTLESGAKFFALGLLPHMGGTTGSTWVQDYRVEELVEGSLIVDGAITASKVAALAIETDKLAANAITAEKIAAGAITADRIAAGTITADRISIGGVTTDRIASNAVSNAVSANNEVDLNIPAVTWTSVLSTVLNVIGSRAFVHGSFHLKIGDGVYGSTGTGYQAVVYMRLLRNGSIIKKSHVVARSPGSLYIPVLHTDLGAATGNNTYDIQLYNDNGALTALTVTASMRSIMAMEMKR